MEDVKFTKDDYLFLMTAKEALCARLQVKQLRCLLGALSIAQDEADRVRTPESRLEYLTERVSEILADANSLFDLPGIVAELKASEEK